MKSSVIPPSSKSEDRIKFIRREALGSSYVEGFDYQDQYITKRSRYGNDHRQLEAKIDTILLLMGQDQRRPKNWNTQDCQHLSSSCIITLIPKRFHILTESSFDVSANSCLPTYLLWRRFPNAIYQSAANSSGEVTFPKHSKTSRVSSMQVNINYTLGNEGCDAYSMTLMVSGVSSGRNEKGSSYLANGTGCTGAPGGR